MGKENTYQTVLKQIDALNDKELDAATNILNILAVLKSELDLFWVGLYYVKPDRLVLGPYQGTLPCTKIEFGNGLCGQTAAYGKTHYVNDVSRIENYIACHAETKAEIVIPAFKNGKVHFVLDIDSVQKDVFNETDREYLEKVAQKLVLVDEKP